MRMPRKTNNSESRKVMWMERPKARRKEERSELPMEVRMVPKMARKKELPMARTKELRTVPTTELRTVPTTELMMAPKMVPELEWAWEVAWIMAGEVVPGKKTYIHQEWDICRCVRRLNKSLGTCQKQRNSTSQPKRIATKTRKEGEE